MFHERQQQIIELLKRNTVVKVEELCSNLDISPATVRRDLTRLEKQGYISRVGGGAVLRPQKYPNYPIGDSFSANDPFLSNKKEIARAAVSLVRPGDTIFIDSGSTNNEIAKLLVSFSNISVVTNSIDIAYYLHVQKKDISIFICGGTIGETTPQSSIVGPLAEKMLSQFRANICFLGTLAVDINHGITDPSLLKASFKREMVANASRVVLVVDNSKFGQVQTAFVCPIHKIHRVITDTLAPENDIRRLQEMGIEVTLVQP